MKGYSVLARACWKVQNEHDLTDREMVFMLDSLRKHYKTNSEIKGQVDRDYLEKLLEATLMVISEKYEEGAKDD